VSAATQVAWLQVIAPSEQLEGRKALRQIIVVLLRHVTVRDGKCAFAADAAFNEQPRDHSHFLLSCKMGNIFDKLFGGGGPVVESNLDTRSSCTSKCCDTEVISEISSSSSELTHASHHAQSRPSFETLPPGGAEIPTK